MEHTSAKAGSMERLDNTQKVTSVVQEAGQGDGIVDQSHFTAAVMFSSLPSLILNELFDHLDIRQATRLTRVSSSWAEEMKQIPKRNNGTALLKNWSTVKLAHLTAGGVAVPKSVPVSHLMLAGDLGRQYEEFKLLLRMLPSVRKITVDGECFGTVYAAEALVKSLSSSFVEVVKFRVWKLYVFVNFDATEQVTRFSQIALAGLAHHRIWTFCFWIDCPNFVIRTDSMTDDGRENVKRIWRLVDSQSLLWPYPPEQLEWLLASLGNLKGPVLETVKLFDASWMAGGRYHAGSVKSRAALDNQSTWRFWGDSWSFWTRR